MKSGAGISKCQDAGAALQIGLDLLRSPVATVVSLNDDGSHRTPQQIKAYLQGRTGILAFRNAGAGFHTELWNGQQIVQRDMNENVCFSQPRVLFWDCGAPQWLQDYMSKQG